MGGAHQACLSRTMCWGGMAQRVVLVDAYSAESPEAIRENRSIEKESNDENELQTVENFSRNLKFTGKKRCHKNSPIAGA